MGCIDLPEGYDAKDMDLDSLRINNVVPIDPSAPIEIGDDNGNGKPDLTVRFDRLTVLNLLRGVVDYGLDTGKGYDTTLTITGKVADTPFLSKCIIRVLKK